MDYRALINSILEFIQEVFAGVQAALKGVVKVPGYTKEENFPG